MGTTAFMLLCSGTLSELWAMINAMQLLAFVIYMKLYIPANA